MKARVRVQVIYALPKEQVLRMLDLPAGSTLADAIRASGLRERFPGIDAARAGIWGRSAPAATALQDGDRVELYRPLQADPKETRRARAGSVRRKA